MVLLRFSVSYRLSAKEFLHPFTLFIGQALQQCVSATYPQPGRIRVCTLHSFTRFLQCVDRFLQCVAYLQLRLHVVDQTGVDTAAVSGNLYLQLVVENDVPSWPVLGAPLQH